MSWPSLVRRCNGCGSVRCLCLSDLRAEVQRLRARAPEVVVPEVLGPDDTLVVVVPSSTTPDMAARMVEVATSKGVRLLVAAATAAAVVRGES